MASASRIMDKPRHHQQQQEAAAAATLKCPRCDSSNTKFCYYNNYSLAQPRHFCKACKRYWTRGGTLRNVPVGGGCRKNKRIKTSSSSSSVNASVTSAPSQNPRLHNSSINTTTTTTTNVSSSAANHINGPMFFGVNNANPSPLNLHFSSLDSGFGFSSSGLLSHFADLREGFNSPKQIQDHISINSMNHFHHPAISFDRNSQLFGNFEASLMTPMKQGKIEGFNRLYQNNQTEQIDLSNLSDPSPYWSSATVATGNWHDPGNNGSSIASLF